MKYIFKDRLSDFAFHDSMWRLISFEEGTAKFKVKFLNVHRDALKKYFENDMEIREAYITFSGVSSVTFEEGEEWKKNDEGEFYRVKEPNIHGGKEAEEFFVSEFGDGAVVYDLRQNGKTVGIDCLGKMPFFTVCFACESAKIEWDEFRGEAYYARLKNK